MSTDIQHASRPHLTPRFKFKTGQTLLDPHFFTVEQCTSHHLQVHFLVNFRTDMRYKLGFSTKFNWSNLETQSSSSGSCQNIQTEQPAHNHKQLIDSIAFSSKHQGRVGTGDRPVTLFSQLTLFHDQETWTRTSQRSHKLQKHGTEVHILCSTGLN